MNVRWISSKESRLEGPQGSSLVECLPTWNFHRGSPQHSIAKEDHFTVGKSTSTTKMATSTDKRLWLIHESNHENKYSECGHSDEYAFFQMMTFNEYIMYNTMTQSGVCSNWFNLHFFVLIERRVCIQTCGDCIDPQSRGHTVLLRVLQSVEAEATRVYHVSTQQAQWFYPNTMEIFTWTLQPQTHLLAISIASIQCVDDCTLEMFLIYQYGYYN